MSVYIDVNYYFVRDMIITKKEIFTPHVSSSDQITNIYQNLVEQESFLPL